MGAAAYLFAHDLLDETVEVVLDRLQRASLDGAILAAAYHHSRDILPHNPVRKLVYLEGGTIYFQPELARYSDGPLRPHVAQIAGQLDPLALLREAGERRGMKVSAWLVLLHNSRLAFATPECATQTAFGDRLLNTLCPANPAVRAYALALAGDVARYELESIKLESLSYMPFDHGYHHERSFVPLSPNIRFLLGLCFCQNCLVHAASMNIDGERVRRHVIQLVEPVFESAINETHEAEVDEPNLRAECDGELGRFLDARLQVVSSLAESIKAAVHIVSPRTQVIFLDNSGATLGYATGRPTTSQAAASIAWRDGIDLRRVGEACDGVGVLAYFAELSRLEAETRTYQMRLPIETKLEATLRPMTPDSSSAAELGAKVALLRRLGVQDLAFYHYGFMRLEALGWIAHALQQEAHP
jgi:hypothetical protein